jgi:hypothetical protein
MTRSLTSFAAACAAAIVLAGTAAAPANAYYLGYGNGDPGGWDFWTEQNGGRAPTPPPPAHIRTVHQHTSAHHHSAPARSHETKQY